MRIKCGTTFKQLCLCYVVWFVIGNKCMDFSRREMGPGEVGQKSGRGKEKGWQDKAVPHSGTAGCAGTPAGWTAGADALGP